MCPQSTIAPILRRELLLNNIDSRRRSIFNLPFIGPNSLPISPIISSDFPYLNEPSFMEFYEFRATPNPAVESNILVLAKRDRMEYSPYRFWRRIHEYVLALDETGGISEEQFRTTIKQNITIDMWDQVMKKGHLYTSTNNLRNETSSNMISSQEEASQLSPSLNLNLNLNPIQNQPSGNYDSTKEKPHQHHKHHKHHQHHHQQSSSHQSNLLDTPVYQVPSTYILKTLFALFYSVEQRSHDLCVYLTDSSSVTYSEDKYWVVLHHFISTFSGRIDFKLMSISRKARQMIDQQFFDLDQQTGLSSQYIRNWEKNKDTYHLAEDAYIRFLIILQEVLMEETGTAVHDYFKDKHNRERKERKKKSPRKCTRPNCPRCAEKRVQKGLKRREREMEKLDEVQSVDSEELT